MNEFFDFPPFAWDHAEKQQMLGGRIAQLTQQHYQNCEAYRGMLDAIGFDPAASHQLEDYPFLPVSLFKTLELRSISDEELFKTMTSSGTTGQAVYRIFLDKQTANLQQKTLAHIVSELIGKKRLPMIVIDCPSVVKDRKLFSARGAGILGFSLFGSDRVFSLDDDMNLDIPALEAFLEKHAGKDILLFGFTFMIWQHFYKALAKSDYRPDLSRGVLIHGGGWKKLVSESVSSAEFRARLKEVCGIEHVHDYYGMVEQTGCIYLECEEGHLHASNFSEVIMRNPKDFTVCPVGQRGVIEVISALPESYPGHVLLTEDEGTIFGVDDCPCGRKGTHFVVHGRLKNAEIRGCSDTYAYNDR